MSDAFSLSKLMTRKSSIWKFSENFHKDSWKKIKEKDYLTLFRAQLEGRTCNRCYKTFFGGNLEILDFP